MSERSDEHDEMFDELVEQYRRHLRGRGPTPELAGLNAQLRRDLEETFALLEAITGMSSDVVTALADDPTAAILGFGSTSDRAAAAAIAPEEVDIGGSLVDELVRFASADAMLEFPNEVPTAGELPLVVAVYRHWGAVVRICTVDGDVGDLVDDRTLRSVGRLFSMLPDTTVVAAVVGDPELSCVVVGPEDCVDAIDPTVGPVGPRNGVLVLPLGMALRRQFEFTEPTWEDIAPSTVVASSFDAMAASSAAATAALAAVKAQSRRMPEKRLALESLGDAEQAWLMELPAVIGDAGFSLGAALEELAEARA